MRNITQHPMTYPEAIDILDILSREIMEQRRIGDIRPYALQWIATKLEELQNKETEA